jgi:hypothetical protein
VVVADSEPFDAAVVAATATVEDGFAGAVKERPFVGEARRLIEPPIVFGVAYLPLLPTKENARERRKRNRKKASWRNTAAMVVFVGSSRTEFALPLKFLRVAIYRPSLLICSLRVLIATINLWSLCNF